MVVPNLLLTVKLLGAEVISRKRKAEPAEYQVCSVYQDLRWG